LIPFFRNRGYEMQRGSNPPVMVKRIIPTTPEGYIDIDRYYGQSSPTSIAFVFLENTVC
jgi:hypothetical protein